MNTQQADRRGPDGIGDLLPEMDRRTRVTLIIPTGGLEGPRLPTLHHATHEERARALDELAAANRHIPPLPAEAFTRVSPYDERF